MIITSSNIKEFLGEILDKYYSLYSDEIKEEYKLKCYELQVHSKGLVYDKIFSLYSNDSYENQSFVLNSYEPITKSIFWQGIDNIKNIFLKSSTEIVGDLKSQNLIRENKIIPNIIEKLIYLGCTEDPNALLVYKLIDDKYELSSVLSSDIIRKDSDSVMFVDRDNSIYTKKDDTEPIKYSNKFKDRVKTSNLKIIKGEKVEYSKKTIIYISRTQYIKIVGLEDKNASVEIINFKQPINPYIVVGVDEDLKSYNSPLHPFIPLANIALVQYRMFNIVHNLYGYPKTQEIEIECPTCRGKCKVRCEDEESDGVFESCPSCNGSGRQSMQGIWNSYTLKQDEDIPENNNVDVVKYITIPVENLEYNKNTYKDTLKDASKSIYIQSRLESANVESAETLAEHRKSMFTWVNRIGSQFYSKINANLETFCILNNCNVAYAEEPISYQILDENESFILLDSIIKSDAPSFLKSNQVEQYLSKYISHTNPLYRIINILKKYDKYIFMNKQELESYSNLGWIDDLEIRKHIRSYPLLQQMISNDYSILELSDEEIITKLDEMVNALK